MFKEKNPLISKWLGEFFKEVNFHGIAILFGSYAKNKATKGSDLDLLCITKKSDLIKKAQIFKTKYNVNLQIVHLVPQDFKNIKKENKAFWNDLLVYGVIFEGLELFFKEVYL